MQLLERGPSLASLASYAQQAQQGDGRLVLVAGEAGVGKSALVERLQADLPGARWSWGACDGLFTPRPLGPLFDLLRFLGRRLRDAPVLLVATYRDEELTTSDPLRAALGEIARQRPTRRIELTP